MHESVLVEPFLQFFEGRNIRTFIDCTVGAAGHSRRLLEQHPEIELLIGLDQDPDALNIAESVLEPYKSKVKLIHANFRKINEVASVDRVDGIFMDLGVSSMQLDQKEKGFSFMYDGPLDMRMDPTSFMTAKRAVNSLSEHELADIFWKYGEENRSRKAAKAIVEARRKTKLETTKDLVDVLSPVLTWGGRKNKNIHPLTQVFQALRIYVNDELGSLERALPSAIHLLASGGRLGAISFHSLEDRIVKNYFRDGSQEKKLILLTKKPIGPTDEEVEKNPRSRSAKLRFVEKR